jgi:hypothetical protein
MLQAVTGFIPCFTASRTTQSSPNRKRSSASRSSVQTQTRLGAAPSSVTVLIASGSECHGVVGGPPRRKIHTPFSRKSSAISRSIDSCVSVMPLAAPAATNSRP